MVVVDGPVRISKEVGQDGVLDLSFLVLPGSKADVEVVVDIVGIEVGHLVVGWYWQQV